MLRKLVFASVLLGLVVTAGAQDKFYTKTGKITFTSKAPLEDIDGVNKTASALLDSRTGTLQFAVLMKGFEFQRALMQEHFNDSYVESSKYPKAEFKGLIVNNNSVNYAKDGTYPVKVKGLLSMHGVTRNIEVPATIAVTNGKLDATSTFTVLLSDYKIAIPAAVKDKVSNAVKVKVDTKLEPFKG
jgi:hypothetical protein